MTRFWSGIVTTGLQLYTNSILMGGSRISSSARPSRFMLTTRVSGSGLPIHDSAERFQAAVLLIE